MKYQRKSPGRRDAHARVARDLAAPLPADDAGVLRRPRRPGAAGLRLGPGEREARELRGDVYVGVALRRIATLALEAGRGRCRVRGSVRCLDDATMGLAAAPMESYQSLPKRCPWGRPGSVLHACKRLRRMRRRFKHFWSISLSSPRRNSNL